MVDVPTRGADMTPDYLSTTHKICAVPVNEILQAHRIMKRTETQATIGVSIATGAFWLGVERLVTESYNDPLFQGSCAIFLCGVLMVWFIKQSRNESAKRLLWYIPENLR